MKLTLFLLFISCAHAESTRARVEARTLDFQNVLESQEVRNESSLSLVRIRTVLDAGIEVPGVTNAKLSPEIELFFTKSKR